MSGAAFPFAAVVGMDRVREALLLAAVEPRLRGVLVGAEAGAAKTVLARAFPSLIACGTAFVELPLGVTEDRLLGGLDIARTLATGRRQMTEGLLARAQGGALYADNINLLDRRLLHHILNADGFTLIGTYHPGEGELSPALIDSAGVHVADSTGERTEILKRVEAFERDPAGFVRQYEPAGARLRQQVAAARDRLPRVVLSLAARRRLSHAALELGVTGHRADLFAVLLARARAALLGRTAVDEEDLRTAVELVLTPRAAAEAQPRQSGSEPIPGREGQGRIDDLVVPPADVPVPVGVLKARETIHWTRGRYLRAVAARPGAARVALEATLRAAAPFQPLRPKTGPAAIRVAAGDLRFKQFKQVPALLVVFAVDASGSMAYHRIHQAKGAVLRLLREAYVRRDQVAVVSFRGNGAEVALPPSRGVERARRAIDSLAVGGGTPVAAALEAALKLAQQARQDTLLVLLTDGRANVGRTPICEEIERSAARLRSAAVSSVVIDTRQRFSAGSEAERLAWLLGGRHVYLPCGDGDGEAVYETVRGQIRCLKSATR